MGRKKRSQKVEVAPRPTRVRAEAVAERILAALCPCCGRTIPEKRAIRVGYVTVDRVDYFASIEWDENKPFGVSYVPGGRGFGNWEHISPEQAPELFEAVKARFIQAWIEWIVKAWITREELLRLVKEWLDKGWINPEEIPSLR